MKPIKHELQESKKEENKSERRLTATELIELTELIGLQIQYNDWRQRQLELDNMHLASSGTQWLAERR